MPFFELDYSIDPKVVGVRNASGQAYFEENFLSNNLWFKEIFYKNDTWDKDWWKRWATIPIFDAQLNGILMEKNAKLTDLIDFPRLMRGFFVNEKLRTILEKSHLPRHRFFEASFVRNKQLIGGYWWFTYDVEDGSQNIDFEKSEFELQSHLEKFGKLFEIKSYQDYMAAFYETGSAIKATKLVFKSSFDKELDIWGMQFLSLKKGYISERLVKTFEENKITGYDIREPRCPLFSE